MDSECTGNSQANSTRKSLNIHIPAITTTDNTETEEIEDTSLTNEDSQYKKSSDKIHSLVQKMLNMRIDEKDTDECMEKKFIDLRQRIDSSVSFLETTKHQIENIKFLYQQNKLKAMNDQSFGDCLTNSHQSVEELDAQMNDIQKKLNAVRARVKKSKTEQRQTPNEQNFESTMTETVNILERIGRGDYAIHK